MTTQDKEAQIIFKGIPVKTMELYDWLVLHQGGSIKAVITDEVAFLQCGNHIMAAAERKQREKPVNGELEGDD